MISGKQIQFPVLRLKHWLEAWGEYDPIPAPSAGGPSRTCTCSQYLPASFAAAATPADKSEAPRMQRAPGADASRTASNPSGAEFRQDICSAKSSMGFAKPTSASRGRLAAGSDSRQHPHERRPKKGGKDRAAARPKLARGHCGRHGIQLRDQFWTAKFSPARINLGHAFDLYALLRTQDCPTCLTSLPHNPCALRADSCASASRRIAPPPARHCAKRSMSAWGRAGGNSLSGHPTSALLAPPRCGRRAGRKNVGKFDEARWRDSRVARAAPCLPGGGDSDA